MNSRDLDKVLVEQAAELQEAMLRGEPGSREQLVDWLESGRHVGHYLTMQLLDDELKNVDPQRRWHLKPEATVGGGNVVALKTTAPGAGVKSRWWQGPVAAGFAAAALLALCGFWLWSRTSWHEYATGTGEQRSVELTDGSLIHLNTQSRLEVRLSAQTRDIRLLEGEALFKVGRDRMRPFRVHTGDATIEAIGTEFNVYRRAEGDTEVAVIEGRVRVERGGAVMLSAGEQARVTEKGSIAKEQKGDINQVTAWRQRRLIFDATPLKTVVDEFNRYNRTPRFVLQAEALAERPYSGIFDADDPESLVLLLEQQPDLRVTRSNHEIEIRVRAR